MYPWVQARTGFASLERVLEYTSLPQEAARSCDADPCSSEWPLSGAIEFTGLSMRYRPGLPLTLVDFSARIEAQQKAGIVGRTGQTPFLHFFSEMGGGRWVLE